MTHQGGTHHLHAAHTSPTRAAGLTPPAGSCRTDLGGLSIRVSASAVTGAAPSAGG